MPVTRVEKTAFLLFDEGIRVKPDGKLCPIERHERRRRLPTANRGWSVESDKPHPLGEPVAACYLPARVTVGPVTLMRLPLASEPAKSVLVWCSVALALPHCVVIL